MPTLNPRLTITLEPLLAAQLRRMSELTGNSQSKLISEILEGSTDVFARVITLLEAADQVKAELKGSVAADLDAAQTRMEQQLGLAMGEFDNLNLSLLKEAEAVKRRAARKRPAQGDASAPPAPVVAGSRLAHVKTPLSNRGVRSVDNSHGEKRARASRAQK